MEYRATFVDSQLRNIVELERTTGPALPISAMKRPTLPSKEGVRNIEARRSEPMTGRRVYVLFGGRDEGYWAEVVAESEHKLCIKSDDHDLQLMNRCFRDHLIWDSEEEAKANRANKRREWDEERREWQSHVDV